MPSARRRISDAGLAMVKRAEGFRSRVYLDQAGLPTIGYGHLLTQTELQTNRFLGVELSEAEGGELLRQDVAHAEIAVEELVRAELTQRQFDALVDFVFNVGRAAFARSTLLRRLNAGDYAIENEFLRWNKVRNPKTRKLEPSLGLTRRRRREADLWGGR